MKALSSRIGFLAFIVVLVALVSPSYLALAQETPDAEEVIGNYLAAMGGSEKLSKIESAEKTGKLVAAGAENDFSIVQQSGKFLMQVKLEGFGDIRRGSDGKVVWENHPSTGPQIVEGKLKQTFMTNYGQVFPGLKWQPDDFDGKIKCTGVEDIDGRPHYKVEFEPNGAYPAVRYFDKETGLLSKLTTSQDIPQLNGEVEIEVAYSNYKQHDGVSMAMTQAYTIDGQPSYTIEYSEVAYNAEIEPAKLAVPEDIKELLDKQK